jgi:hypothetical protein
MTPNGELEPAETHQAEGFDLDRMVWQATTVVGLAAGATVIAVFALGAAFGAWLAGPAGGGCS